MLVLLILIYKKQNIIDNFITNNQQWLNYRLGDVISGYKKLYKKKNNLSYIDKVPIKYKNSIAHKYLIETKNLDNKNKNLKILKKIVDNEKYEKPNENDVILHLRIGDVILGYKNDNFIFKKSSNGHQYCIPLKKLDKVLKSLDNRKKIILLYGSHKIGKDKLSKKYINEVEKLLKKNNFQFEHKNSGNPDQDFVFMCNSKNFIKSGGGFSNLISNIVTLNGGRTINLEDVY